METVKSTQEENELIIDTSKMSAGQRDALEVTESARESAWVNPSFVGDMFMGTFNPERLDPFPQQSPEDKAIGDKIVKEVISYLEKNVDPEQIDRDQAVPQQVIDDMMKMGLFALKIPKKYDGLGLSQVNYNRVMSAVSSHCGSTAVLLSAHQSIGVPQPLKDFGTEEQKKKYLPLFRKGAISAFALTEPSVGSDPAQMSTKAELSEDGTHYILTGEKLWCTNGLIANVIIVMAQTAPKIRNGKEIKQITAFIVEKDFGGVETVHSCELMGIRGIQIGVLRFNNVKVPVENVVLGEGKGLKLALTTLNTGRLTIPAACSGMGKQCLSIARRWGNKRVQWGAPIGKHQAVAEKLSHIASSTFAMEAITYLTSHWADQKNIDIRLEAAMAKMFCSETAWDVIDKTLQIRGGSGYETATSLKGRGADPYPLERMLREARINRIIEGTTEIMKLFLARETLDPHLRIAKDLIRPGVPLSRKLKATVEAGLFYVKWYPQQWFHFSIFNRHHTMGKLSKWYRFVEGNSHKLARTMFLFMMIYQARLERQQLLLGKLMEIGTELFAISATCAYAKSLYLKDPADKTPLKMAETFCLISKNKINNLYQSLWRNDDGKILKLSKDVLKGSLKWFEKDIVWVGPKE